MLIDHDRREPSSCSIMRSASRTGVPVASTSAIMVRSIRRVAVRAVEQHGLALKLVVRLSGRRCAAPHFDGAPVVLQDGAVARRG